MKEKTLTNILFGIGLAGTLITTRGLISSETSYRDRKEFLQSKGEYQGFRDLDHETDSKLYDSLTGTLYYSLGLSLSILPLAAVVLNSTKKEQTSHNLPTLQ